MRTRLLLTLITTGTLLLSGCDIVRNHIQEVVAKQSPSVVVIPGGYPAMVDGQVVQIFGFDACYEHLGNSCIVLDKTRVKVPVELVFPKAGESVSEVWDVVRLTLNNDTPKTAFFRRPNGSIVERAP